MDDKTIINWIGLSCHLKNFGDLGGCHLPRRITPSSVSMILQIIRKPNSIIVKYLNCCRPLFPKPQLFKSLFSFFFFLSFFIYLFRRMNYCKLEKIESGTFRAMHNLTILWVNITLFIMVLENKSKTTKKKRMKTFYPGGSRVSDHWRVRSSPCQFLLNLHVKLVIFNVFAHESLSVDAIWSWHSCIDQ